MDLQAPLTVDDPSVRTCCCAARREAITNAVRHSGARNLWLQARIEGGRADLRIRDDGRGTDLLVPGNGLQGMRERLRQHGGWLEVVSRRDEVQLNMSLPIGVVADAGPPRRSGCMIRVFLVDDQTLVRQGIRSLLALADGIEVVAEAADGRQALEAIPRSGPTWC